MSSMGPRQIARTSLRTSPKSGASSKATARARTSSARSDATTQTETSTDSPQSSGDWASDTLQSGEPATPRRERGLQDESWGLSSLDPSTWPVLKDAFGASSMRFTMDRMSMASVPEGDERPVTSSQMRSLEDELAKVGEQKELLHQLCWDILVLAKSEGFPAKEAPLSAGDLVVEAQKGLVALRQRLAHESKPKSAAQAGLTPGPRSPMGQFRLVSAATSTSAPSVKSVSVTCPAVSLQSPPQVTRFVSAGTCATPTVGATSPIRTASPMTSAQWPVTCLRCAWFHLVPSV
eukprot:g2766.t1